MDTSTQITDAELADRLRNSYLDEGQKKELEPLIPEMNDEEKNELLYIIKQAEEDGAKVEEQYQLDLGALNQEYTEKMEQLNRDELEKTRKDLEKAETEEEGEELKELESEIMGLPDNNTNK